MLFTEPAALFVFLPLVLAVSRFTSRTVCNYCLLVLSLLFYAQGESQYTHLLIVSSLANYVFGISIELMTGPGMRRAACGLGIAFNLVLLGWYKYLGFAADNLNTLLKLFELTPVERPEILLPLGISFFTFQGISYLLDVFSGQVRAERNPVYVGLYIALFPQLIAGPIVRFSDIAEDLRRRTVHLDDWSEGLRLFILGCARKMLIANPVGETADAIFSLNGNQLSTQLAWIGLLAYSLQIYFDFSGYSTMAVGIGRALGFRFPENFSYPYFATSMRDFWRRWHMSLSTWFRDYLYIPLGGNRGSSLRTTVNLLTVFLLCGLWHGASWNFVIWGGIHGFFLTLERTRMADRLHGIPVLNRVYTLSVVLLGWVFFRCETFTQSVGFLKALAGLNTVSGPAAAALPLSIFVSRTGLTAMIFGVLWSTPVFTYLQQHFVSINSPKSRFIHDAVALTGLSALFLLTVSQSAANTFNPFIYFRF
jgi:alginate O-acetyltransferase complex protein AlgI